VRSKYDIKVVVVVVMMMMMMVVVVMMIKHLQLICVYI
jgi:hypothetical protein